MDLEREHGIFFHSQSLRRQCGNDVTLVRTQCFGETRLCLCGVVVARLSMTACECRPGCSDLGSDLHVCYFKRWETWISNANMNA